MARRPLSAGFRRRGRDALARRFGVDARALAALRVALGLLLLADLSLRARDLAAFYTDAGVLPRPVLREQFPALARLSLHAVSGTAWVQAVLFVAAAAAALALAAGYRTTLAAALSWVLLVSLHARNPLLLNAGDSLLRRLLFWGLFLPLGARWSVDARRRRPESVAGQRSAKRVASVASVALLTQVVLVYAVNAAFKLRGDAWLGGEAMRYAFGLDQLTLPLGDVVAGFPLVLELVGWAWLALLVASVLLVALTGRARTLLVALFVAAHVAMAATLRLGVFPWVCVAGLLPFLPERVWNRAESVAPTGSALPVGEWFSADGGDSTGGDSPARASAVASDIASAVGRWRRRLGRWKRRVKPAVVAGLLAAVLVWNAATLGVVGLPDGAGGVADPGDHRWDMFAPEPRTDDGWYVVPGRLESGERVDALHRTALTWDRPPELTRTYPNVRWMKYLVDLQRDDSEVLESALGKYLCRRWNGDHEDELTELEIYYVEEPTRLDGPDPTRRIELAEHSCSGGGNAEPRAFP